MWRALPHQERKRFLRHVRAFWDTCRHRVAPEIGRLLENEMAEGRLESHAGRITEYHENLQGVDVCYQDRKDRQPKTMNVDYVINCTGPESDCRRVNSSLMNDLLNQQAVRPDPLHLGLDTAENGALLDGRGVPSDFLYTVGPLRKGNLWESTAVPEIREQAAELASHLTSRLQPERVEDALSEHAVA